MLDTVLTRLGGIVATLGILIGLFLQVWSSVKRSRADEAKAAAKLRRVAVREGYDKRTSEIAPVIDRVTNLLDGALSMITNTPDVQRRLNRAMTELSDAREGEPNDDD